ncbi:MAG: MlaA family lipoprotein, partial [bacterium]|nr:MlaA family lipoprotein [bacterium]
MIPNTTHRSLSAISSILTLTLLFLTFWLPASVAVAADDENSRADTIGEESSDFDSEEDFTDEDISDPLETVNRGIFWFNEQVDYLLLEPVARGYDYITPDSVQRCVGNFFDNLSTPVYLISDLTQLKFEQFADHTGRFVVNTTFGVAGLFDVAA